MLQDALIIANIVTAAIVGYLLPITRNSRQGLAEAGLSFLLFIVAMTARKDSITYYLPFFISTAIFVHATHGTLVIIKEKLNSLDDDDWFE